MHFLSMFIAKPLLQRPSSRPFQDIKLQNLNSSGTPIRRYSHVWSMTMFASVPVLTTQKP
jgi:hypothetical protein